MDYASDLLNEFPFDDAAKFVILTLIKRANDAVTPEELLEARDLMDEIILPYKHYNTCYPFAK